MLFWIAAWILLVAGICWYLSRGNEEDQREKLAFGGLAALAVIGTALEIAAWLFGWI